MTEQEAAAILAALGQSEHPFTGLAFTLPPELSDPRVLQAFRMAATLLAEGEFEPTEPAPLIPSNQGARWTPEAEHALIDAWRSGTPIADLAQTHQRTRGAIRSRLVLLGLVERPGDIGDRAYLRSFERQTFVFGAFGHRGHVRVARQLLLTDPEGAAERLEAGLRALLASYGDQIPAGRGFHHTLTHAWLRLVQAAVRVDPGTDFKAFAKRHPELLDGDRVLRHYSPERLYSEAARAAVLAPDRERLP